MRIAQITDTHIAVPPLAAREADLERHIDAILALDPRPDLVVHTGDAANSGSAEEYAVLRRLMARLPMPWVIVPGNRDSRARMRAAFAGLPWIEKQDDAQGDAQAPLIFTVRLGPLLLIGMDSKGPRTNKGWMDKARLARLDSLLAQAGGARVIIAMHHPPFEIAEMRDSRQFADWEHVRARLRPASFAIRTWTSSSPAIPIASPAGKSLSARPSPCPPPPMICAKAQPAPWARPRPSLFMISPPTAAGRKRGLYRARPILRPPLSRPPASADELAGSQFTKAFFTTPQKWKAFLCEISTCYVINSVALDILFTHEAPLFPAPWQGKGLAERRAI